MFIAEETDEYHFVQHVTRLLDVPNTRPDLEPGGLWIAGKFRLSWGLRTATEPPTLQFNGLHSLTGSTTLPFDMPARLAVWRTAWANREHNHALASLDFRDVVKITAILSWNPPENTEDEDL
jgi:hypothetical protein